MKLETLYTIILKRKKELPKNSYTVSLLQQGEDAILQKIGEESTEMIVAAKNESKQRIIEESCDVLFHTFVLLNYKNITLEDIEKELEKRNNK